VEAEEVDNPNSGFIPQCFEQNNRLYHYIKIS
jgi:hypothetical protein